ncbi:MAG: DNA mismatch repair endonuclease MutL, partial [Planctomycetaceae bacterium]
MIPDPVIPVSRIRPLDPHVINKIAAGEVIERPASVVKELLENGIDALATRIEVDVAAGGTEMIRLVDDGEGMHPDDLPLAVASHATSKLADAEDLFRVRTMGFRGEALASIAAVSRLRVRSRQPHSDAAQELEVVHGEIGEVRPCGGPVGTLVEVRRLFANTPVRRRFLKTVATEFSHLSEQFTRIAIAHPRLHLVLRHNGNAVYELPATNRLLDRVQAFHGREVAEGLIAIESQTDAVRLWGYAGHPSQSRSSRKGQYLFLNGRWIQDRALQHALGEAYRGLLMTGRYPIAFLFLEMPPELVDVNVHPTKAEVRFRDGQEHYRHLLATLRTKFLGMNLDSKLSVPGETAAPPPVVTGQQLQLERELVDWAKDQLGRWEPTEPAAGLPPATETPSTSPRAVSPEQSDSETIPAAPGSPPVAARVMQVHDCYIITETEQGLTVIDQHALHERVLYEQLRRRVLDGAVESQRLLVPETMDMNA